MLFVTGLLICLPLGLLYYKSEFLKISLLPQMVDDLWNIHITVTPRNSPNEFSFPIPKTDAGQRISDEKLKSKNYEVFIESDSDSTLATWSSKDPMSESISFSSKIDLSPIAFKNIGKDYSENYPRSLRQYLTMPELIPEDIEAISTLETAILEGNEDKTSIARKIYYYVEEEIQKNTKVRTIHETLSTGKGSPLVKAKLFNIMARRNKIPSRIIVMLKMPDSKTPNEERIRFSYANEIYLNKKWVPVDTNLGYFGSRPDNFMIVHKDYDQVAEMISTKNVRYVVQVERALINKFNRAEFKKTVQKSDSIFATFSLFKLPLPLQLMFSTILLIPIGTLVLSVARNIIGIPTFGIFTPILLTLFFKETSFGFGLLFFSVVVLVGIFERYVLDKFHLLAVPRLSILLTLVILLMMGYSLFSNDVSFFSQKHLAFFPIVIVTTNIERLSIMITEEGLWNTFKTLFGTLIIAILGYSLYAIETLEMFMFSNPELLFTIIGVLILIGKYKGYRVSEFIRFRDLVRQRKKLDAK